jgi:hypothetical protein
MNRGTYRRPDQRTGRPSARPPAQSDLPDEAVLLVWAVVLVSGLLAAVWAVAESL